MPEDVEIERMAPSGEVAQVLHALADGVEVGSVTVGEGDEAIEVAVPEELEYELELEVEEVDGGTSDDNQTPDEEDVDVGEGDGDGDVTIELEVELEWTAGEGHAVEAPSIDRQGPAVDDDVEAEVAESPVDTSPGDDGFEGPAGDEQSEREPGDGPESAPADVGGEGDEVEPAPGTTPAETTCIPVRVSGVPDSAARFELFRDRAGEWRWRLVHRNGNVIADGGEGYARKIDARNGLESVRTNAPAADVVEAPRED